jgi:GMP synthase (glutamine-hydrolysing)
VTDRVLILQNLTPDGPGFLATWLAARGVAFDVFDTEAGHAYPGTLDGYRALALMGGEMSANDDLPSLRQAETLIRQAMSRGVPVLGHCLGGQLMARALGAVIGPSPEPEIGWQAMQVVDTPLARDWFGAPGERTVYHWHQESFGLPAGAECLAASAACPHQAFAIGPHLAMQFHVELDRHKLAAWSASTDPSFLAQQRAHPGTVQSGEAMRDQAATALAAQQDMAAHLYARWLGAA